MVRYLWYIEFNTNCNHVESEGAVNLIINVMARCGMQLILIEKLPKKIFTNFNNFTVNTHASSIVSDDFSQTSLHLGNSGHKENCLLIGIMTLCLHSFVFK